MSKRFGRNQRRRAREALAAAELATQRESAGRMMAEGIARDNSRKLADLREHMAEFVARVGRYAVAADPERFESSILRRVPRFNMAVPQHLDLSRFLSTASEMTTAVFCSEVMHVLEIGAVRDEMTRDMHCRIYFDEQRIGYGISAHAIRNMTAEEITRRIAPEIAWALVREIKGKM